MYTYSILVLKTHSLKNDLMVTNHNNYMNTNIDTYFARAFRLAVSSFPTHVANGGFPHARVVAMTSAIAVAAPATNIVTVTS